MHHLVEMFGQMPAYSVRANLDLTIDAWNRAASCVFGWSANEAVGAPAYQLLRPTVDQGRRDARAANLHRRGWWRGRTTLLDRDGEPLTLEGMCWSVLDHGERHYVTLLGPAEKSRNLQRNTHPGVIPILYRNDRERGWLRPLMTATAETPGQRITLMREQAGLTKYRLARLADVSERQLRAWENDFYEPTARNLLRLIPYIGGTVEFYLTGAGD